MKILIAGDFCPRYRVSDLFDNGSFEKVFGRMKPIVGDADYAIANFECAVADNDMDGIVKAGPCLSVSENAVEALKWAGFDGVTLANNHFRDFGNPGVSRTLDVLKSKGIDYVGGGNNKKEAAAILYKDVAGKRIAIVNACEEEFSIATEEDGGSNLLNPVAQFYSIQEARSHSDFVLVIIHGGHEHYQLPSPRMKELYRFFVDAGADVVVNHHQHCYSGYEVYKEKLIFYGLGNFCFDHELNRKSIWNEGYLVELEFDIKGINFCLHPYVQCDDEASVLPMMNSEAERFNHKINELNAIIADDRRLKENYKHFVEKHQKNYNYLFTPWDGRYPIALFNRGMLPFITSKKKLTVLYDYLVCPSHQDNLIYILREKLFTSK